MPLNTLAVLLLFLGTLVLIASGKTARSCAALVGAALLMGTRLINFHVAIDYVDFNTVGILMGMMIIVGVLSRTGIFQFVAVKTMKLTRGNGLIMMFSIAGVTAVLSAFLDNVTTVLLISPIVVSLADIMETNPIPLLVAEALASNIGGTATLIGDPPNIIIGSFAGLSFLDFLTNLTPVVVIILIVVVTYLALRYREELVITEEQYARILRVDEKRTIKDKKLLIKSGVTMLFVLAGFTMHHLIHLEAAVIALLGASLLLLVSGLDATEVIHKDVEWPTLIFFISLFIVVGALKEAGIISMVATQLARTVQGHPMRALLAVLWLSGISCAFVNNVAFTATFVYVVDELAQVLGVMNAPLFWALALGACLGGNGTLLGSAANVVVADFGDRSGHTVTFHSFMKVGMTTVIISLTVASAYLLVRYHGL